MFYTYDKYGTFFAAPNQVGQSELLLKFLYFINKAASLDMQGLYMCLALFETISVLLQLIIFGVVYSATEKKEKHTAMAFAWIIFNPISLVGGFTNLGSFNDAVFYLVVLLPLLGDDLALWNPIALGLVNAIAAYFDPRVIFFMIPFTVLQARLVIGFSKEKRDPFRETTTRLAASFIPIILTILFVSSPQLKNLKNILLVNNPAENLGSFWYL